jgi:hypothetical protein
MDTIVIAAMTKSSKPPTTANHWHSRVTVLINPFIPDLTSTNKSLNKNAAGF